MAEYPYPRWVLDRAQCNVSLLFELLLASVRQDIDDAKRCSPLLKEGYKFFLDESGSDQPILFKVRRGRDSSMFLPSSSDREHITVIFRLMNGGIKIDCPHHPLHAPSFWAFSDWNADQQTCRLKIGERIYQPWEVSRLALGYLFFDTLCPSTS